MEKDGKNEKGGALAPIIRFYVMNGTEGYGVFTFCGKR
jgi:hypothetical protein